MRLIGYVLCISSLPIIRRKATEEEKAEAYRVKGGNLIPGFALIRAGAVCGIRQAACALGGTGHSGLICLAGEIRSYGLK
jgi:hypothetical protein